MFQVNVLKHDEKLDKKKVRIINLISFLLGFSAAITAYIISSYFQEVKGGDNVSIFYSIAYIIALIALLNFHKLIKNFGKSKIFLASLILMASSSLLIYFFPVSWTGLILIIINIILYNLCLVGKDLVLESYSTDRMSGRIRGIHLTLMNVGFIIGPFISTRILDKFNFQSIFLLQFIIVLIIFFIVFKDLRKINHKFKPVITVEKLIKKIFKKANVLRIYYISIILEFFYFIAVVYTPIYLRNLGIEWSDIGIIFTIMLVPFVLLQYPAGRLADKKMGERELIIFALFVMSITTLSIFFVNSTSILIWGVVLFSTRIGASLIEILRDSYFYKRVDGADVDVIDFFRTSRSVGFLSASIFSAVMLLFFPLKYIFIMLAIIISTGLYPAFKLKDNLGEEEVRELKK